jgi:hypothetical protein
MKGMDIPWKKHLLPLLLLPAAVASHVLPHPWWGFTAVGASLLVWGARESLAALAVPVAAYAAADWYLTSQVYRYPFHVNDYLLTWAWYALVVVLGFLLLRGAPSVARLVTAGVLAPTSFFLASNYAVWASPGSWYPHTVQGLLTCYTAGLPFYRNDVLSTGLVMAMVWGVPAVLRRTSAAHGAAAGSV